MAQADCCSGTLHDGTPIGRVENNLHGLPCYVSDPPAGAAPTGFVVIIPDAFGWELPNSRILADNYAKRLGCTVLLPELMDGNHLDYSMLDSLNTVTDKDTGFASKILPGFKVAANFPIFLYRCRFALVNPRLVSFLTSLREQSPNLPVGVAGFCWGGKFIFSLCAGTEKDKAGKPLVDCGFTAHPSNLALPADAEGATIPMSLSAGDEDFVLSMQEVKKIQAAFEKKGGAEKGFEVVVVEGGKHGFAVRGNPEKPEEARQCLQAEDQAVAWFTKWLIARGQAKL